MQNEHHFIFSGRDSFEIRGGGRHSSTYGGQIVNIKINIDLFMSFFTNGLQKNCVLLQTLHTRFHFKTFKLLKPAQKPRGESPEVSNVFISNGASALLYS